MPASARQRSTTAGDAVTLMPSASYTSAPPVRLDADRLPCLATRTPAAATTSAAHEEMLNVPDLSPPVPHVSTTFSYRFDTCTACARIAFARPTISTGRSPFIASPTSSPAMCAGAARPAITSLIAAAADDVAAEDGADRLMPEADAENRRPLAERANDIHRHARLLRPAGPGRDHDVIGPGVHHVVHRDGVVAHHADVRAELAQILHE